jgi:hypothetical protein
MLHPSCTTWTDQHIAIYWSVNIIKLLNVQRYTSSCYNISVSYKYVYSPRRPLPKLPQSLYSLYKNPYFATTQPRQMRNVTNWW